MHFQPHEYGKDFYLKHNTFQVIGARNYFLSLLSTRKYIFKGLISGKEG